jgi:hypothetical protein
METSFIVNKRGYKSEFVFNHIQKIFSELKCDEIEVIIKPFKHKRSLAQNRFMWGALLDAFVRATGDNDKEYLKFYLQEKYLKEYRDGNRYIIKGTSELKVDEMQKFLECCVQELVECGGYLESYEYEEYLRTM